mgnify:FL=1
MTGLPLHHFSTPFAAYAEARRLAGFVDDESLLPAFASSKIKILPYQIAAARFALRSNLLKGCILCDEGSLGKTYEALLVVSQRWYEGKQHILIVLPQNLTEQWQNKLAEEFTLPVSSWEEYKNADRGVCLVTYDEAVRHAEQLDAISWDLAVFDEADFLFKPENKTVIALKKAVGNAFKLLLTPTPITLSIMDIYGLIHFIDETVLPDAESFYKRYFRKPENYGELSAWVSKFAFRTLKSQVQQYVNFTRRLPIVLNYIPEDKEKKLYDLIQKYLAIADKQAYPQMDNYQLTLRFYHTLSSSPQALASMLAAPIERTRDSERIVLTAIRDLAAQIPVNAKMQALLSALNKVFAHLKFRREAQKAIVFTDNSVTAEVLSGFLQTNKYNVVKYTDDDALKQFRNDKSLQILIANDAIAKGLDIEYCPVVVNYDLLYNAVEMEQRICRCHRQGQKSDVLVINLLSQENFSDVRILELINKRTLQFDGIFGMSDNIVDNFDISLDELLARRRPFADIERDFEHNLAENKKSNEQTVASAEDALFTTFTKEIADKFAVSPQYIQEQADKINEDLWEVVKYYFQVNFPQYIIDDTARTLTLPDNEEPPHLFYYNSGTRNVPYTGRRAYGMSKDFKPAAGRISLTSVLVQGILSEISCYTEGEIIVDALLPSCEISCFNVDVTAGKTFIKSADVLTGKNGSGRNLDDIECRRILNLPVVKYSETGKSVAYWLTIATSGSFGKTLDIQTEEKIKEDIFNDKRKNFAADIDLIKMRAAREKTLLEQKINETKQKVTQTRNKLSEVNDRLEELKIQKQLNLLEKELRKKEEGLFFDQMQIDVQTEEKIDNLTGTANLKIKAGKSMI